MSFAGSDRPNGGTGQNQGLHDDMPQDRSRKPHDKDIDAHLKRAFQSLTEEAIPDELTSLLDRLRAEDGADDRSDSSGTGSVPE